MADVLCDQLATPNLGGSAVAGLGGASTQIRGSALGRIRLIMFSFTIPASGAGSANGDRIILPGLNPSARVIDAKLMFGAMGAGVTLAMGRKDSNNDSNSDNNHYINPVAAAVAGVQAMQKNWLEQVGVDATGAVTDTGDGASPSAPGGGYGSGPVNFTVTIGGATPTAAAIIMGYLLVSSGG